MPVLHAGRGPHAALILPTDAPGEAMTAFLDCLLKPLCQAWEEPFTDTLRCTHTHTQV